MKTTLVKQTAWCDIVEIEYYEPHNRQVGDSMLNGTVVEVVSATVVRVSFTVGD